jgi:hypothetical protein
VLLLRDIRILFLLSQLLDSRAESKQGLGAQAKRILFGGIGDNKKRRRSESYSELSAEECVLCKSPHQEIYAPSARHLFILRLTPKVKRNRTQLNNNLSITKLTFCKALYPNGFRRKITKNISTIKFNSWFF